MTEHAVGAHEDFSGHDAAISDWLVKQDWPVTMRLYDEEEARHAPTSDICLPSKKSGAVTNAEKTRHTATQRQMTALNTHPVLETERLILRRPTLDDLDRWSEMMADPESARFIGGVLPRHLVWRAIMQYVGAWELAGVSMFSVIEKTRGVWIGRVGPWYPPGWPAPEIGWGLHRDAWGRGYALEAAVATMNYAFDTLEWSSVVHCIAPENVRSRALATRLGSRIDRQAVMPPPLDHETLDVWAQTSDEWRAHRQLHLAHP